MDSDDLKNAQATMKERYSHPKVSRLDKRSGNGQLERERQQVRELQAIKREQKRIIKSLKAADDVQSKRLLWDILDRERDRIEGRPHTATPPPKPSSPGNSKLMDDIQGLFAGGLLKADKEPADIVSSEPTSSEPEPSPASAEPSADLGDPQADIDGMIAANWSRARELKRKPWLS
jgi:hypothetical protein